MSACSLESQRRRHWEMLLVSSAVVILAFLMEVRGDEQVVLSWLPSLPLPPLCFSYAWFGIKCPGCGLTRSLVLLAHGDWIGSLRLHHLGFVMAAAIVLQFPYRLACLGSGRLVLGRVVPNVFGELLIAFLLANWLAEAIRFALR